MAKSLNIEIVTPAPRYSRKGNRVSAERWAKLLRELGHRVHVTTEFSGVANDVTIALHARRVAASIERASEHGPVVLVLTGTDVYRDIHEDPRAQRSLELADALVTLQELAAKELPTRFRARARTIIQSVEPLETPPPKSKRWMDLCVVGHLREVKDPMLAAKAARDLPEESRIRIVQAGGVIEQRYLGEIEREQARNPRYHYAGDLTRAKTLNLIARSHALVLTSHLEGGANVIGEACVCGTPVLSTDIDGSRGLLGDDYEGYFPVGDAAALADLMTQLETDGGFRMRLARHCRKLAPRFAPETERKALAALLHDTTRTGRV